MKSLTELLTDAGLKTAAAKPAPTPAKTAAAPEPPKPVPVAPAAPAAPAEPKVAAAPKIELTPAQEAMLKLASDPKVAEAFVAREQKLAEMSKTAELEKMAKEQEARGAIFADGIYKRSAVLDLAMGLATGASPQEMQAGYFKVAALCRMLGCNMADIIQPARHLAKQAMLDAADAGQALVSGQWGEGARPTSATMQGAERNGSTSMVTPEGVPEGVQPTRGLQPEMLGFQDTVTIPGNPGLNLGQKVDPGKGM